MYVTIFLYFFLFIIFPSIILFRFHQSKQFFFSSKPKSKPKSKSKSKSKKHIVDIIRSNSPIDEQKFQKYITNNLTSTEDYLLVSKNLREIIQKKFLTYNDLKDNPEKFFKFHQQIGMVTRAGSFFIKFTVQYNLFAGSVIFLGNQKQINELNESQKDGKLGCFALTEKNAGVLSGMIVETNAVLQKNGEIILSTPEIAVTDDEKEFVDFDQTGACKTWISQGFVADFMVVFANLILENGENKGVHAFFLKTKDYKIVRFNDDVNYPETDLDKQLNDNTIYMELMVGKGSFQGLDNTRIIFNDLRIPSSSLLSRYCEIDQKTNVYRTKEIEKFSFIVIAQRLLTGRAVIGFSTLVSFQRILNICQRDVLEKRMIFIGKDNTMPLIDLPHYKNFVAELEESIYQFSIYTKSVLKDLCYCLKNDKLVDDELFERISITKIVITNYVIDKVFKLKAMIGSESLFVKNGFSDTDMFYCGLFAEGDNRILQQKITRDHLTALKKKKLGTVQMLGQFLKNVVLDNVYSVLFSPHNLKMKLRRLNFSLQSKLVILGYLISRKRRNRKERIKYWFSQYKRVYEISDIVCEMAVIKSLIENTQKEDDSHLLIK